jgi:nucleoside-diphosphate-sugar epimerase
MSGERRVLVTGATGFAGSHLLDALVSAGYPVRVPVRPSSGLNWLPAAGVECVPAEMRDASSLRRLVEGMEWIFHFAGVTRAPRPEGYFEINTDGTRRLFEAAAAAGNCRFFLYCSSLAAGGPAPSADRPRREEDPPAPISPYGRSKRDAEAWLLAQRAPGTRLVIVRPPAIYGPRDAAILTLFRWVRRGIMPLPAPRGSLLSLVEARDLAGACKHLAEVEAEGIFYVSDGGFHSWEKIGALAGQVLGLHPLRLRLPGALVGAAGALGGLWGKLSGSLPAFNQDKASDFRQRFWICAVDRLRAAGYATRMPLEKGIPETLEWYRREGWL